MAALYSVQYPGRAGLGSGAMYVGNGAMAGFDIYGGRYKASYREAGGRISATGTLSMPDGGRLVTGQDVPPKTNVRLAIDWPSDLGAGNALELKILGQLVRVAFYKMVEF